MTTAVEEKPTLTVVPDTGAEVPAETEQSAPDPATNAQACHGRAYARARDSVFRAARFTRPPDLWAHDRPSLRATWRHAVWGEQVPPGSLARGVYVVLWALVCAPAVAVFYLLAWAHERPLRTLGFWAVVWALWQVTPVRAVLSVAAHWNVPSLAAHIVTNLGG